MKNSVTEVLGIEKPVVQAPMAWITSPELVAAVSNAGGLGTLGYNAGFKKVATTPEETAELMRESIRRTKELTDKPFAVNITGKKDDPYGFSLATAAVCAEEGVQVIVMAGELITDEEIKDLKDMGFIVIARELNPTVKEAQRMAAAGADVIVATGVDEGGCMPGGTTGTLSITALLAANVDAPVLGAGGIVNEATAKAIHCVGAEGAFVGSRFILSDECPSAPNVKEDLLQSDPDDMIVFTQWNGLSKWRSTPTKVAVEAKEANEAGNMDPTPGSLRESMLLGNLDMGVNSATDVISLVKAVVPAAEIVDEIARGFED